MKYFLWCIFIYNPCHCTLLQLFINHKSMNPARNIARSQQCHKQRSYCVALTKTISQNFWCRKTVIYIVSEQYFISYEIVYVSDALKFIQLIPFSLFNQLLYFFIWIIQHHCFFQIFFHIFNFHLPLAMHITLRAIILRSDNLWTQ